MCKAGQPMGMWVKLPLTKQPRCRGQILHEHICVGASRRRGWWIARPDPGLALNPAFVSVLYRSTLCTEKIKSKQSSQGKNKRRRLRYARRAKNIHRITICQIEFSFKSIPRFHDASEESEQSLSFRPSADKHVVCINPELIKRICQKHDIGNRYSIGNKKHAPVRVNELEMVISPVDICSISDIKLEVFSCVSGSRVRKCSNSFLVQSGLIMGNKRC